MSFFNTLVRAALGLALALSGLLLTLSLALAATLLFGGVVAVRLVRGQRPLVPRLSEVMVWLANSMGWRVTGLGAWPDRAAAPRDDEADVVEVPAREVVDTDRRLDDDAGPTDVR